MKSQLAEMELSMFRQRSQEAIKLKAARGEFHSRLAVGYMRSPAGGIDKDPDARVREAIELVFRKFAELGSVRQVLLWYRQESITVPCVQYGAEGRKIMWKLPVYNTLRHILTNPVYAGAYAFGRNMRHVKLEAGRKRFVRERQREQHQWRVLICNHHEGYIAWETYEHNQKVIAENTNMLGEKVRGSIRGGEALLGGLMRCGHCARKLHVEYGGRTAPNEMHLELP